MITLTSASDFKKLSEVVLFEGLYSRNRFVS